MKRFSVLLVLCLTLVGCREVITEPDSGLNPTPSAGNPSDPTGSAESMYLKGPKNMRLGDTANLRGDPYGDGILEYSWQWSSPDGGEIESEDPANVRFFDVTATHVGTVTVTVTARDPETGIIDGMAKRTFPICPRGIIDCTLEGDASP